MEAHSFTNALQKMYYKYKSQYCTLSSIFCLFGDSTEITWLEWLMYTDVKGYHWYLSAWTENDETKNFHDIYVLFCFGFFAVGFPHLSDAAGRSHHILSHRDFTLKTQTKKLLNEKLVKVKEHNGILSVFPRCTRRDLHSKSASVCIYCTYTHTYAQNED